MKLLLIIPLILSWNFMFWGVVGICRYASELAGRHERVLALLALFCGLFLLAGNQSDYRLIAIAAALAALAGAYWLLNNTLRRGSLRVGKSPGSRPSTNSTLDESPFRESLIRHANRYSHPGLPAVELINDGQRALENYQSQHGSVDRLQGDWLIRQAMESAVMSRPPGSSIQALPSDRTEESRIEDPIHILAKNTRAPLGDSSWAVVTTSVIAVVAGLLWHLPETATHGDTLQSAIYMLVAFLVPALLTILLARSLKKSATTEAGIHSSNKIEKLFSSRHVAVLIPAYNESNGVAPTIRSAIRLVGRENVFVVNDCSRDDTAEIIRQHDVNLLDLTVNIGKAKALQKAIRHFDICQKFQFLLVLDADTEIDKHYLDHALPCFVDPEVSAVAGHAIPKWSKKNAFTYGSFFVAYRIKLYMMTQAFLRYGQTSTHLNVSFIVPGFSSIYRTRVLPEIDIAAPGLVIEDFNMTFELHRKNLGRIAYSPKAVAYCHEPHSFSDYTNQIKRWHLGFWQTVVRHGFWRSRFSASLIIFIIESLLISAAFIAIPILTAIALFTYSTAASPELSSMAMTNVFIGLMILFLLDIASTIIVAWIAGIPALIWHGLFFFVLRWTDAVYFIATLPMAFVVKSNGRWTSPSRIPPQ
jgi:cellulose synthase/poly-beta-1,6-N-acetylglucosamine synthase-like glycosyltransferase